MRIIVSIKFIAFATIFCLLSISACCQAPVRTIHVFVALCDNENQGIVPVPPELGNGKDPRNNLYWGARYGVKTFLKRSNDWELISAIKNPSDTVLERCVFKHETSSVYLVADAYQGSKIKQTVVDFLQSASGNNQEVISVEVNTQKILLGIRGSANLVAYVGHNGLMDFQLDTYPEKANDDRHDAIILACFSKSYFSAAMRQAGANPLLWTTGLMAPEAYALKSAIDGWILNESGEEIRLRAAKSYHKYQRCGLNGAKNLLVTGW